MDRISDFRNVFAHMVVARGGCPGNDAVLRAFQTVRRHDFVGPGPWVVREDGSTTPSADPALVYQDINMGLTATTPTGVPSLHASFLDALRVVPGLHVMQVGAGTGYFTAILAELVGDTGRVLAFELDEALAARAQANLVHWPWVRVEPRSGIVVPDQPVDIVYVNAGVQQIPREWLSALRPGGRLLFPLVPSRGIGAAFLITSTGADSYSASSLCRAQFVPCIGTQDDATSARLAARFHIDSGESVRSLRLAPSEPDDTVWFAGQGWWLSTEA
jgi:protein-L-isoaspartate(D-aspartate) O-methyltransferase